ncbi:MAG TPA: hypothetical protein VE954_15920 [Oligoflexus sp.]|uniref:hypothetical protein n=1 Tax=Oligoflexus sp. TaxID=1971216 RepID=UPI002D4F020D|nr:hypothetical protein [Oligoflexus sp.]HYX34587.1 hypothetical protein [Oligoflexus sp.]
MVDPASVILSSTSLVALRSLIALRRSVDSKFSYSYISKRIGIKSRSYLSEVFNEKKKLNPKHVVPIVELLALPLTEAELLKGKLMLDVADLNEAEAARIRSEVRDSEKKLTSGTLELSGVRDINLVMLIGACLHLFKDGKAIKNQIFDLFKRDRHLEVEQGLYDLIKNGLLVKEGDQYSYSPDYTNILHVYLATNKKNEIDYLKSSIREALDHVSDFQNNPQETVFYSGIITAEKARYLQDLDYVKQNLRSAQSRIESNSGDTIIRFNVQIYPVATHAKRI